MKARSTGKRANGEGTLSKRKDKTGKVIGWRAALTVGLLEDGTQDRRWVSGKTQAEVQEKLRALQSELHTGTLADAEGLTLGAFLDRWIETKTRDSVSVNTLRSYQDTIRLYLKPQLGRLKLEKLRPLDVERLLTVLAKEGKSARMMGYALLVLKMALRQAVRWQMIPRNVAEGVRAPKVTQPELQVWTPEQVASFLEASQTHRLHAAFYLALMTGMRRGEVLGLQWQDIDWERSRLAIRHNLIEVRTEGKTGKVHNGKPTVSSIELQLGKPKTAGSRRTIVLSPGTLSKLKEHQERQAREQAEAAEAWATTEKGGYVFATELGTATDPRNFYRWFVQLVEEAGVPVIRFHDLRHTAASLMIRRGIAPKTVSERLGHADVGFTLRTYTHLYDEQREEAAFDLSDFFPKAAGGLQ